MSSKYAGHEFEHLTVRGSPRLKRSGCWQEAGTRGYPDKTIVTKVTEPEVRSSIKDLRAWGPKRETV